MKFVTGIWFSLAAWALAGSLEFKEELKEVKAAADVSTLTSDFEFTNKSDKAITIAKTDPGCSCLKVQISGGKFRYEPGESGVIRTTFDMGNFSGTVDKVIALWLDNDPADKPSRRITVRVHIPVLVELEPKTVAWDVSGKSEAKTVKIRMAEGEPIKVLGVKGTKNSFSYDLKTIKEGKEYDLVITPTSVETPDMSVIRIETDAKIAKHRTQQAFAVIRKPVGAQAGTKP